MTISPMIRNLTQLAPFCLLLVACASKPIIDTKGVDMAQYKEDLRDCTVIAEQVSTGKAVAKSAGAGAAVGAAVGVVTSVITGDTSAIGESTAYGAVGGGSGGALKADEEKARVIKNCLRNRGYVVLN